MPALARLVAQFDRQVLARCKTATLLACLSGFALAPAASALAAPQGAPVFQRLKSFGGPPTGEYPFARLMQGTDGALYGTATAGGSAGGGTVFKVNPDVSGFTVLQDFEYFTTGGYLNAGLMQGTDGALYGTAYGGGTGGVGTVFKLNPDGTGFTILLNFDDTTGSFPSAGLMQGMDGDLYGTATVGGSGGWGTVFKLSPDGTAFTVLQSFDNTNGATPYPGLMQGTNGALYGTTYEGGSRGYGTVFKLNPDGTGFTILKNLRDSTTGASPLGTLMQGTDGALYGTASSGGSGGSGTVFKLNPDGTGFTVLQNFDLSTTGANPHCGLMQGTDGNLYGTAYSGGSSGSGTLFKLSPDGTGFTVLQNFDLPTTGANPRCGLMQGTDGRLYGTASDGGRYDYGTLFTVNPDGTAFTVVKSLSRGVDLSESGGVLTAGLVQGTDGALYGTTTFGGNSDYGTVFKLNADGTGFTVLEYFDKSTTGSNPWAGLMQGTDGALYGTAYLGGSSGYGTVFKLNPDGTGFTVLQNFDGSTNGANPFAGLMQGVDGALYGTAYLGGSSDCGTVFKLNPDGTGFAVLQNFDRYTTGVAPFAGLLQGTDGVLYGTAQSGGSIGYGTVFKLNPDGTGFTVLENFDYSTTGAQPIAGLLQGTDGKLYGTAYDGGAGNYEGTLFKLNPDGTGFAVLQYFDYVNGARPTCQLLQGTDGALYGTTRGGGSGNNGTVFKLNPDGTGFAVLQNFDSSTNGGDPRAGLIQGTDGNLYGTTTAGGDFGVGTVFRLILDCSAAWSNYGTGFAGTNGVPNLTVSANPVLGTTITLAIDNSLGSDTSAFLLAGLSQASIPFKRGTLLVGDIFLVLPLSISAAGTSLDANIPDDDSLCGLHVDLQVFELDPGATLGVSFTPGLDLMLGR